MDKILRNVATRTLSEGACGFWTCIWRMMMQNFTQRAGYMCKNDLRWFPRYVHELKSEQRGKIIDLRQPDRHAVQRWVESTNRAIKKVNKRDADEQDK